VRGQRHASAALYPRERPGTHCTGGWVVPRAGLDRCGKSRPPPTGIRSPDRPARTQSLYRIRKPAHLPLLVEGNLNSLPSVVDPEMAAASPCESYCLFPTLKSVTNYSRPSTNPKILCLSTSMTRPGKIILAFVFAAYNRTLSVANTATVLRQYYYY